MAHWQRAASSRPNYRIHCRDVYPLVSGSRGPRILLACSFVSLLGGYAGIRYLYNSGLAPDALSAPAIMFFAFLFAIS